MKADDVHYNLVGCNDIILEEKRKRRKYRKTINKPTATTQQRLDQISTSAHTVLKLYQKGINDVHMVRGQVEKRKEKYVKNNSTKGKLQHTFN